MDYFPAFMNLAGRRAVVIGGGEVAARKSEMLMRAGARVTVVAPVLTPRLADAVEAGDVAHRAETFEADHLNGAPAPPAATDDPDLNALVARHGRLRGLPVNVVDDAELSGFIVPAVIDRAPVTVAVSTGGASPVLARWVRARIEAAIPTSIGRLAGLAGRYREAARERFPDIGRRRRFWETLFDGPATDLALEGRESEAEELLGRALAAPDDGADGEVHIVGAGPGDPELLTIKALRALQGADVIVHDRLVSDAVLDLARRDAERVYVGKQAGRHAMSQQAINDTLVALARDGKRVVRLKGGDPFVFGRGGEEMETLAEAGIVCHLVPGITAATGCAAWAGIPLTHRDHAQACTFITGHGKDGLPDLDWAALAAPRQTVVIYMGLANLGMIADRLIGAGRDPTTPVAVIADGTAPDGRRLIGTLTDIGARVRQQGIKSPALIIVGEVVALARPEANRIDEPQAVESVA